MRTDRSLDPRFRQEISPTLHECLPKFTSAPPGPILDLACGAGRHTLFLASLNRNVVAVDADIRRLATLKMRVSGDVQEQGKSRCTSSILLVQADLLKNHWPMAAQSFSILVIVHYLQDNLLPLVDSLLIPGGYIYLETYGGHGQNHLSLPRAGAMRVALERCYEFDFYRERRVGPPNQPAVSVRFLARKLPSPSRG